MRGIGDSQSPAVSNVVEAFFTYLRYVNERFHLLQYWRSDVAAYLVVDRYWYNMTDMTDMRRGSGVFLPTRGRVWLEIFLKF